VTTRIGVVLAAGFAALVTMQCIAAGTAFAKPDGGKLSDRLAKLARSPELRQAPPRKQAARLDLAPRGAGSLLRLDEGLVVNVRVTGDAGGVAERLRAAGGKIVHSSQRYRTVTVAAPPSALEALAAVAGVEAVTEQLSPITSAAGAASAAGGQGECQGSVTSEADGQLNAEAAREEFGISGAGIKVGILSDSFNRADGPATDVNEDVASGDLPGPGNPCGRTARTQVLQDFNDPDVIDEGRAMAQLVHDLAPEARLAFATAAISDLSMASNIRRLENEDADVIVDDVTWLHEPFFQAGPIDNAVSDVSEDGVVYYSSAGNSNLTNAATSWETPSFRGTGDCPGILDGVVPVGQQDCLDFDPDPGTEDQQFRYTIEEEGGLDVVLQWAEAWEGVETDLDVYLLHGTDVVAQSELDSPNVGIPFEFLSWANETGETADVRVVVNRASGDESPRVKFLARPGPGDVMDSEYQDSSGGDLVGPAIWGHNGAADALSVAAVPFFNENQVEPFSSRGPVTHYFEPVAGATPADPLDEPLVLEKPDLAATDGALTTFFSPGPPPFRFFGTSAAAPHAAAVAALLLDGDPSATPQEVADVQRDTADPVGPFPPEAAGAGLVDALAAADELAGAPPTVTITDGPPDPTGDATPTLTFTANEQATFRCAFDGGAGTQCRSPFTPNQPLADGEHTFEVTATDGFGQTGNTDSVSFTLDATGPNARITKTPKQRTRKRRARFTFSSPETGATFLCKLDRGQLRPCTSPRTYRVKPGKHKFIVRAVDELGNRGPQRTHRWTVRR